MEDKIFDSNIKSALENFEMPYEPATWEQLVQRMDAPFPDLKPQDADPFDSLVSTQIGQWEAPYAEANWNALASRMNTGQVMARRVRISKVAEMVLFALLLWNFGPMLDLRPAATPQPVRPKHHGPVAEKQAPKNKHTKVSSGVTETLSTDYLLSVAENAAAALAEMRLFSENLAQNGAVLPEHFAENAMPNQAGDAEQNPNSAALVRSVLLPFALLPGMEMEALAKLGHTVSLPFAATVVKKHRTRTYYVSNYISNTRQQIYSPADPQFEQAAQQQWANAYGGGVSVGVRKGKWGAEAGVAYTSTRYTPEKRFVAYQLLPASRVQGASLAEIDLDVLTVPVQVSRQIAQVGKTKIRARAGATAQVATQASYRYKTEIAQAAIGGRPLVWGSPDVEVAGKGVFEGGGLQRNAWLTVDTGLRAERNVGGRFVAFVEPVYSRPIAGNVGPKGDRIGGIGVNAGVMATL